MGWLGTRLGLRSQAEGAETKRLDLTVFPDTKTKRLGLTVFPDTKTKRLGLTVFPDAKTKRLGLTVAFQGKPTKPALAEGPAGPGAETRRRCNGHRHLLIYGPRLTWGYI